MTSSPAATPSRPAVRLAARPVARRAGRSATVPVTLARGSMLLRAAVAAATIVLGLLALALPAHGSATPSGTPPCVASVDHPDGSTSARPGGSAAPRNPCR